MVLKSCRSQHEYVCGFYYNNLYILLGPNKLMKYVSPFSDHMWGGNPVLPHTKSEQIWKQHNCYVRHATKSYSLCPKVCRHKRGVRCVVQSNVKREKICTFVVFGTEDTTTLTPHCFHCSLSLQTPPVKNQNNKKNKHLYHLQKADP